MATRTARAAAAEKSGVVRSTRATRTTKAGAAGKDGDELAQELSRVLRVSEPEPQQAGPSRRRIPTTVSTTKQPAASTSAVKEDTAVRRTAGTAKTPALGSRKVPTTSRAAPSSSATISKAPTRSTSATTAATKGKQVAGEKKSTLEASLPWLAPDLSYVDRARGAMGAINETLKSLSGATAAGYKHGPSAQPSSVSTDKTWTEEGVEKAVATCELAIKVLREIAAEGKLGSKVVEVDRAELGLAGKCVLLGMVSRLRFSG